MDALGINPQLLTILRKLSKEVLTESQAIFLARRLSYGSDAQAWKHLQTIYHLDELTLRKGEQYVLQLLSSDSLCYLQARLNTLDPGDPICDLPNHERRNLTALIERTLALRAETPTIGNWRSRPSVLPSCPAVVVSGMQQPEHFLEWLVLLHKWLHEAPRTLRDLRLYIEQRWRPMLPATFQSVLDLLYALDVIAPAVATQTQASVQPTMPVNLNVAQFRNACAEQFAQRVKENHVLIAVVDHLGIAPLERIEHVAFGDKPARDLAARLVIWEALGIIQAEKKQRWSVTQAGRALVATLPPVHVTVADVNEILPPEPAEDWLDVL